MTIGVLALQGDFEAHQKMLESCGNLVSRVVPVRDAADLEGCDGLIIPGGESTVMSRLCDRYNLWEPLRERLEQGMGAFGTCAGMIMLAKNIEGGTNNFPQKTLGALDIDVARNAYGAQLHSFETDLAIEAANENTSGPMHAVFIRAPRIMRCGEGVKVLAEHEETPVVVRQERLMASSFHPELSADARLHRMWLNSLQATTEAGE